MWASPAGEVFSSPETISPRVRLNGSEILPRFPAAWEMTSGTAQRRESKYETLTATGTPFRRRQKIQGSAQTERRERRERRSAGVWMVSRVGLEPNLFDLLRLNRPIFCVSHKFNLGMGGNRERILWRIIPESALPLLG